MDFPFKLASVAALGMLPLLMVRCGAEFGPGDTINVELTAPIEVAIPMEPSVDAATAGHDKSPPDPEATRGAQATATGRISEARYTEAFRPQYHFSPVSGWIGDPDGMIRYRSRYHLFWWGHAESEDLVHWTQRPDPMVGDDGSFVYFSGSVVVDEENRSGFGIDGHPPMVAIYTMHDKTTGEETQGLSISHDYTRFEFYEQNPVLDAEQAAFRDPQVFFHEPTDRWIMVITLPEERRVRFYASQDLKRWEHLSDFGPVGARSQLWEVPDLFPLPVDGDPDNMKWVLLCGMGPNREQYFIGDFDGRQFTLDPAANGYLLRGAGLPGTVFADFEEGLPAGWTVEGSPITVGSGDNLGIYRHSGHLGANFLSTVTPDAASGDRGTITLTSTRFVIEHRAINFLISGANESNASVNLIVDGTIRRRAAGDNTTHMKWVGWDMADLIGAEAQIQIVEAHSGADVGHLNVDHLLFSDVLMESGREHANWLDHGPDYYAVRIYRDYDGVEDRTVTMGWMGNWEYARAVPTSWGKGALALPREIDLRSYQGGLRLIQRPIPAIEQLRRGEVQLGQQELNGIRPLAEFMPARNVYEIDIMFALSDPHARFGLRLAVTEGHALTVGYDARTSTLFLDRSRPENGAFSPHFPKIAVAPLAAQDGTIRLHLFVDQSSVELFANDGERTMTALIFPDPVSTGIELFSERGSVVVKRVRAWELNSIWDRQEVERLGSEGRND